MPFVPKRRLPRLQPDRYRGHAFVFWTLTLEDRGTGWLTPAFHAVFRELMLHAAARYHVWCPAYCLMPDHLHLLWLGMHPRSDQLLAMRYLRQELEGCLGKGHRWQRQAHDHVLDEDEREQGAFARTCFYVLENPVRASLVAGSRSWPYAGCVVPGYRRLHPGDEDFWPLFWRLYAGRRTEGSDSDIGFRGDGQGA